MPAIQRQLSKRFRHDPKKNISPELGIAVGAAILGRTLNLARGPALTDVVPIPIGVMLPGGITQEVIPKNAAVPITERLPIDTRPAAGQPLVIAVYEAMDPGSVHRELLGTLQVQPDWLEANPGPIDLEMRLGQDFDLTLAVISPTGKGMPLEMKPPRSAS